MATPGSETDEFQSTGDCPKCGKPRAANATCPYCGVVYAKFRTRPRSRSASLRAHQNARVDDAERVKARKYARIVAIAGPIVIGGILLGFFFGYQKPMGSSCAQAVDCRSWLCLQQSIFGGYCTATCDESSDCAVTGYRCEVVDDERVCIRGASLELGASCQSSSDCLSRDCRGFSTLERFCVEPCAEPGGRCPPPLACVSRTCMPIHLEEQRPPPDGEMCPEAITCPANTVCACDDEGNLEWTQLRLAGRNQLGGIAWEMVRHTTYTAERPVQSEEVLHQMGVLLKRVTYRFDEAGHPAYADVDEDDDGIVDERSTYTFDEAGNRIREEIDWSADGEFNADCTYDWPCPPPYVNCERTCGPWRGAP